MFWLTVGVLSDKIKGTKTQDTGVCYDTGYNKCDIDSYISFVAFRRHCCSGSAFEKGHNKA
jgi:hypothetical protein